ncbi:ATP-dependent RNA helicase HrpA [Spongorhabdus nitratireducens]
MNQTPISRQTLQKQLSECMLKDQYRLRQRLNRLKRDDANGLEKLSRTVEKSVALATERAAGVPVINYDDALPVAARRDELLEVIGNNQVIVVAGETGSGKTTQLPKICLELGRGIKGMIGHTQPRRLAARSVSNRIAEELNTTPGDKVGYQVRFTEQTGDNTLVKVMTDGILLAEIPHDRFLNRYDTLIIDEAHERSLNIDFLLGYIKLILPRRPDLKVIITSATIDVDRFSKHFDNAPVIEVSGRTYPVETRYRPLEELDLETDDSEQLLHAGLLSALQEIEQDERAGKAAPLGDVLVFLSGERDIREAAKFLRDAKLRNTEVLPLYARLSAAEQQRIFRTHAGRRIILSTNVAETSLTVPGIRYVIDPGMARISRYSVRSNVQRLPVEAISQASANQRMGRCGRVAEGICYRLYSEQDFLSRPEFTDAEIKRTNLAAVILQMLRLGLGDVSRFPFVDAPEKKAINDGFRMLLALGAVDTKNHISAIGKQLSRLPIDPRIGRMLLAAAREGALNEVLVIASALSIQDPRERPVEKRQAADQRHREFYDENSDFMTLLNLWNGWEEQRQELSQNQLRKYAKSQFLSFMRMREWRDMHRQLMLACKDLKLPMNPEPASYDDLHKSLLPGLLGNLGSRDEEADYMGARNRRFFVFPTSALYKRKPRWVMSAELVETSRLFARTVAKINPDWIEPCARHLVKRQYFEPHWEKRRGQVVAFEQVTLYGLIIVAKRRINYGRIDPKVAREIFIRSALVEGEFITKGKFYRHNLDLLGQVEDMESRVRRRDILVDEEQLYGFYDERIPENVTNAVEFEQWRKKAEKESPELLHMNLEQLMREGAATGSQQQYPDHLTWQSLNFPLKYQFEPGQKDDGVTLEVPVGLLAQLPKNRLEWLVPGMLRDKCIALIRGLPKAIRRNFVPVPDYVDAALDIMSPDDKPLTEMLSTCLLKMTGIRIPPEAWQGGSIENHLQMNIRVLDDKGKSLGEGRDASELRERFSDYSQAAVTRHASGGIEREGLTQWDFGDIPEMLESVQAGMSIKAWPALVDEKTSVALKVFDTEYAAQQAHVQGVVRLIRLMLPEQLFRFVRKEIKHFEQTALFAVSYVDRKALLADFELLAIRMAFLKDEMPRTEADFKQLLEQGRAELVPVAQKLDQLLYDVFRSAHAISKKLKGGISLNHAVSLGDIRQQMQELLYPGFLRQLTPEILEHYPRYMQAVEIRQEKLARDLARDRAATEELQHFRHMYEERKKAHQSQQIADPALEQFRWLLEEYRVSLFAQTLGTQQTVSAKRLRKFWETVIIP